MVMEGAVQALLGNPASLIVFEVVYFLVMGFFIWMGIKVAQVKKGSFLKAVISAFLISLISSLLILPFGAYAVFTIFLSVIINLAVIKIVFKTNWRKSLITWLFSGIAHALVLFSALLVLYFL